MKKTYQHVFFDLDHTIWDYETNARYTLLELYAKFELDQYGVSSGESFYGHFSKVNDELWSLFNVGKISKFELRDSRFRTTFERCGAIIPLIPTDLLRIIGGVFMKECSKKSAIVPGARETLDALHKKYALHIITNGFEETQSTKLESSELAHYFDHLITSEQASAKKPFKEIFQYAMRQTGASVESSIMIGDNLHTDINGARDFGMDQVYFNPDRVKHNVPVTHEVEKLQDLLAIL